jgi:hypothetical protein
MKEIAWWTLAVLGSAALVNGVACYGEIIARIQPNGNPVVLDAARFPGRAPKCSFENCRTRSG